MIGGAVPFDVRRVSKRYGRAVVLRDVSLAIGENECVALLGANGAGKTTLLRTMATLSRPTRGQVLAFGVDAWEERQAVRARIGVVAHQPWVYPELTCRENLRFFGTMFRLDSTDERVDATLERVGLAARADSAAGTLSRGLLQRLNLARALLHAPAALLLDEPDTGLDAAGREVLARLTRDHVAAGGCVVLTTHALDLALDLATRVIVVSGGAVVADGPRAAVTRAEVESAIAGMGG